MLPSSTETTFLLYCGLPYALLESGINARQGLSLILASAAGVLSGAASSTVVILGANVATTRITASVDANGDRTAITLNPPA